MTPSRGEAASIEEGSIKPQTAPAGSTEHRLHTAGSTEHRLHEIYNVDAIGSVRRKQKPQAAGQYLVWVKAITKSISKMDGSNRGLAITSSSLTESLHFEFWTSQWWWHDKHPTLIRSSVQKVLGKIWARTGNNNAECKRKHKVATMIFRILN